MGGDPLTQQGEGDGAGRKQVCPWAGGTPESETNPDVDGLRNIGIEIRPGFRVKPRERPDHEASSSRLVPESESNQESDQAAPIRYEIGLARRDRGSGRWARRRPQYQAQRCRDREFLRLPSFTLHEIRRVPVGNPQGAKQMKSRKWGSAAPPPAASAEGLRHLGGRGGGEKAERDVRRRRSGRWVEGGVGGGWKAEWEVGGRRSGRWVEGGEAESPNGIPAGHMGSAQCEWNLRSANGIPAGQMGSPQCERDPRTANGERSAAHQVSASVSGGPGPGPEATSRTR